MNHIKYTPLYLYGAKRTKREISQETIIVAHMRNTARRGDRNKQNKQTDKERERSKDVTKQDPVGPFQNSCCSVAQSCLTFCDPMDCSRPGFPVLHSQGFLKLTPTELVKSSTHLILCRPLLLLPSIFPSMRVFSNKSALHIRWPKDWNFSISISSSNEYRPLPVFSPLAPLKYLE